MPVFKQIELFMLMLSRSPVVQIYWAFYVFELWIGLSGIQLRLAIRCLPLMLTIR